MRVLPGGEVFKLMDSGGIPFWLLKDLMGEEGEAFDVREFVRAARDSGNFSEERLLARLSEDVSDPECLRLLETTVAHLYRHDSRNESPAPGKSG